MATTWDVEALTPGAGLLCPVLLLQTPGHTVSVGCGSVWAVGECGLWVSVGWLMVKFGGGSTAPLSCCFSSEEITTGKTQICQKT